MFDISGYINRQFFKIRTRISLFKGNTCARLFCYINNIRLGKKVLFYGRPIISRYQNSQINIGGNTSFRSDHTCMLGHKTPCIIRTRRKNAKISIGENCGFNAAVISAIISIEIGNNVKIGFNTTIIDYDGHSIFDHQKSGNCLPIVIKDNVFVGMNVAILKGVTIGEGAVIGANSVVTSNIPPNVIAAGNPCSIIKSKY
jgi:acetyltransferase-like isoleucine patch superfamily enzyme